jgi:hypothetical protein
MRRDVQSYWRRETDETTPSPLLPRSPVQSVSLSSEAESEEGPPPGFGDPSMLQESRDAEATLDVMPVVLQLLLALMRTFPLEPASSIAVRLASSTVHVDRHEAALMAASAIASEQALASTLQRTVQVAMAFDPSERAAYSEAARLLSIVCARPV